MLIFCAIATPRPRAPTSCNPFVRRFNVACTPTQPQLSSASHNSKNGRTGSRSGTRATSTTHPSCNMRGTSTSRANAIAAGARRATGPQRPFCQHCCQHVATALPCPPCRTSPPCSLLCRGRAPQLRSIQDAAKSQSSPGPPGRLRLLCVCVCVLGDVMFLCRLMCILLSGRPPSAMRLLPRSVVLAAVLLSLSVSVLGARVICCSPTPRCRGCALVVCCTVRTVCAKVACGFAFADACGSLSVVPPHHTTSIHHTPHHAISTHLIHHTPRIPTIFTTTHYHSFLSTQVWDGVQFTVCLGCTACA